MLTREQIAFYLDDIDTPYGQAITLTMTGLIVLSCVIFVAETYPLPAPVFNELKALDTAIIVIFAVEYLLRLWCAENKRKFVFSLFAIIDLLAILPFFIGIFNISYLRIFRWFRILRLIRFLEVKTTVFQITNEDSIIVTRILFTLFTIIFIFSGFIYQVEHPINQENFTTFFDAVYFCVVTMTTVGFGDVTPISQAGKFLTVLMILTGIVLIPWQLGDLIKQLVKTANHVEITCRNCGWKVHDTNAKFCKICGTKLEE